MHKKQVQPVLLDGVIGTGVVHKNPNHISNDSYSVADHNLEVQLQKCILSHQLLSGIRPETSDDDGVHGRDEEAAATPEMHTWGPHLGFTHGVHTWGPHVRYTPGVHTWGPHLGSTPGIHTWDPHLGSTPGVHTWGSHLGSRAGAVPIEVFNTTFLHLPWQSSC